MQWRQERFARFLQRDEVFPASTPENDWEYYRGVRPLPVLWVRDSSDRWHASRMNGYSQVGNTGEVMLYPAIVPPLEAGTAWIDMVAMSQSAEVRVRLPLRWA